VEWLQKAAIQGFEPAKQLLANAGYPVAQASAPDPSSSISIAIQNMSCNDALTLLWRVITPPTHEIEHALNLYNSDYKHILNKEFADLTSNDVGVIYDYIIKNRCRNFGASETKEHFIGMFIDNQKAAIEFEAKRQAETVRQAEIARQAEMERQARETERQAQTERRAAQQVEAKRQADAGAVVWGSILAIIGLLFFQVFRVNAKGYVIDVENDTLEFPGGGIEAESWLSYFNPMFWLQGLTRHQRTLSQIRHIQAYTETNRSVGSSGNVITRKSNIVEIDGDFGAVRFSFWSKGKMGQFYSAIVQLNEMGFPIANR
jgi:cation transport ATPase